MKASELIEDIQRMIERYGDKEVELRVDLSRTHSSLVYYDYIDDKIKIIEL